MWTERMHVTLNNDADAQTIVSPSMTLPDPLGAHEMEYLDFHYFIWKKKNPWMSDKIRHCWHLRGDYVQI